jgi:hypothetical protein
VEVEVASQVEAESLDEQQEEHAVAECTVEKSVGGCLWSEARIDLRLVAG